MEKQKELKSLIARLKGLQLIKTQKELAERIGFDKTNLSSAINGNENYLTDSLFNKIYNEFPELGSNENIEVYQPQQIEALAKTHIPYYNVDFAGGWSSEEMFVDLRPDFYINNPEFDRSDFACNLRGKSVSKIIPDGAVVGFKIIEDWQTYFPLNELYGIITKNDFRTVKLIGKTKDGKSLILKPQPSEQYSDRYKDQEEVLPIEFVTKFLQVVAYACYERLVM